MINPSPIGSQDWSVPQPSRVKYTQIFNSNDLTRSGFISAHQAKILLLQSGLSQLTLAQIWTLSDIDADGRLSLEEFILAMHLIDTVKNGEKLPNVLPPDLVPFSYRRPGLGLTSATIQAGITNTQMAPNTAFVSSSPSSSPSVTSSSASSAPIMDPKLSRTASLPVSNYPPPAMLLTEWAIPQPSKLKYTQQFNTNDRTRTGFLTGPQARNILLQSGLPQQILAQIWNLSDIDVDGQLTCEEFVLAMHLIDCVKAGDPLPGNLPPDLIPPSHRRRSSVGSLSSLQSALTSATGEPATDDIASSLDGRKGSVTTFEDKRRENFEKGQAELERRRNMLLEQQRREKEERERKEREEHEKREKLRLEQERRRQQEMERQLQKQRELEAEKEEQRRKQLEQREAARREMERQRMVEWENQRKQELTVQKQKLQETVSSLKSKKKSLIIEVEQVNNQVTQLQKQVDETRKKVSDAKSDIDKMRADRDVKLKEINFLKAQMKTLQDRQLLIEQDKLTLSTQLKDITNINAQGVTDSAQFALQNKQIHINQLKTQIEETEKERENRLQDIENNNKQLTELKDKYEELIEKTTILQADYEAKRIKGYEFLQTNQKNIPEETNFESSWGDNPEWSANANSNSSSDKLRYRAIFAFEARNHDELTIEVGDEILVTPDPNAEPGWLHGEIGQRAGWFPAAYAELISGGGDSGVGSGAGGSSAATLSNFQGVTEVHENETQSQMSFTNYQDQTSEDKSFKSINQSSINSDTLPIKTIALYPWKAKEDNHLSFNKGDIIIVKEQQEMWWLGETEDKQGWFPKSYVKPVSSGLSTSEELTEPEYYISLYPFQSQEPGDLSFDVNQLIKVTKKEGEWWTGEIDSDRYGIFPSNYVKEASSEEMPKQPEDVSVGKRFGSISANYQESSEKKDLKLTSKAEKFRMSRATESQKSKKSKIKKPEIVRVIASYKATGPEQLSLEKGQLIQVRKKNPSGWWEGEIQIKGKKKQIGWFPASYVKPLSSSGTGSGASSTRSTPDINREESNIIERVISLYAYKGQQDDELTFGANEMIRVLSKEDTTWWKGQLESTSAIGLFPSNHVQSLNELENKCYSSSVISPSPHHSLISVHQVTIDPYHLELKRQKPIKELISTEESYVNDLKIVLEVFEKPFYQLNILPKTILESIFLNWSQLLDTNRCFYKALKSRKNYYKKNGSQLIEMIGDVICDFLPNMINVYISFCSRQLKAAKLLQKKTEDDVQFRDTAKSCSLNYKTNGLPLGAYLLKPMQRITKYPLLIKKILENTEPNHRDFENCLKGYQLAQSLCDEVNEACRSQESEDRLEWIQTHVKCSGLDQTIYFNSYTNFLGPRKLIYYGCLTKANSGKELLTFLFNDFLLLSVPDNPIGKFSNLFACDKAINNTYRLYKKPFLLNDISVYNESSINSNLGNLSTQDSTVFTLAVESMNRTIEFKAMSSNDKNAWIKNIQLVKKDFNEGLIRKRNSTNYDRKSEMTKSAIGRLLLTVLEAVQLTTKNLTLNSYCKVSVGPKHREQEKHRQIEKTKVARCCFPLNSTTIVPSIYEKSPITLFTAKWNYSMQFLITDPLSENCLYITCFDEDPFSPDFPIGELIVSLDDIVKELEVVECRPLTKEYKLRTHKISSEINPILYVKLDLQLFNR